MRHFGGYEPLLIGIHAPGQKDFHALLINDTVVVRLTNVLMAAEQHLVNTLQAEKNHDLLKQVRSNLIQVARPTMEAMMTKCTNAKVVRLHHDVSTVTDRLQLNPSHRSLY